MHNTRICQAGDDASTHSVHHARMSHWADELHATLLEITGAINRPDVDMRFLARTGVKLDRALFPLLTRIGAAGPIGAVELAGLMGRDHSTVSRQLAKLEELGLVERSQSATDGRVRLLQPSSAGRKMLAEFARTRRKLMEDVFRNWSSRDRTQLVRLLKNAAASIDSAVSTGEE